MHHTLVTVYTAFHYVKVTRWQLRLPRNLCLFIIMAIFIYTACFLLSNYIFITILQPIYDGILQLNIPPSATYGA